MYKVPYPPPGGKFIKCVGEEYQVVKGEENFMAVGTNITGVGKGKGSNIIFPIILRLLGRISIGKEGKGTETLVKKIKIYFKGGGEEYQVGNFIHP